MVGWIITKTKSKQKYLLINMWYVFSYSFFYEYIRSFFCSSIHPLINSFFHSCIHSFIHSFVRSFIHPFIYPTTHSLAFSSFSRYLPLFVDCQFSSFIHYSSTLPFIHWHLCRFPFLCFHWNLWINNCSFFIFISKLIMVLDIQKCCLVGKHNDSSCNHKINYQLSCQIHKNAYK